MDILPVNFKVLQFCGAWREREDRNLIVRLLNFCYRYAIVILIYHFTVSEFVELMFVRDDIDDLTECLFTTLTYAALCFKFGNFLIRKKEILLLLNWFRADLCLSQNPTEKDILNKYHRKAKWCALSFMALSQMNCLTFIVAPLLTSQIADRPLPFKLYLPYSVSECGVYVATYLQQVAALIYGILLNVSFDSLVYGFTLQINGQIELLCHRLTKIFDEIESSDRQQTKTNRNILFRKCIKHHVLIYKLVHTVQSLFVWIVTVLFFFSLITLCTSIFQMTKKSVFSAEFFSLTLYLSSMLFQSFCYCWFGNELDLKSKGIGDDIYACNWSSATVEEQKSLLIVMTVTQKGLTLSYYGIFALSLHTFTWYLYLITQYATSFYNLEIVDFPILQLTWSNTYSKLRFILKTSYSAFNLLQQVSD